MTTKLDRLVLIFFLKLFTSFVQSCCLDFFFQEHFILIITDFSKAHLPTHVACPLHQVGSGKGVKLFVCHVVGELEYLQKVKVRLVI